MVDIGEFLTGITLQLPVDNFGTACAGRNE